MQKHLVVSLMLLLAFSGGLSVAHAEEYMKRGATVEDYEQALNRVMERKRGLTTGRERQVAPITTEPSDAKSAPFTKAAPATKTTASASSSKSSHSAAKTSQQSKSRSTAPSATTSDVYAPAPTKTETSDGVSIYFGYNSADLTKSSMMELQKLGQALTSPQFSGMSWLIEGHTDSAGSADYNQTLSERRAQSAQRYLVKQFGIEPDKLIAVGKGESEPYDREHPTANVNRRVRLRPTGG